MSGINVLAFSFFAFLSLNIKAQQPSGDTAMYAYTKANRSYLCIANYSLGKPISVITRLLTKKGYSVPEVFESYPGALLNCQYLLFKEISEDSIQLYDAGLMGKELQTTKQSVFKVVSKSGKFRTIDISELLTSDSELFFIDKKFGLGSYFIDSSVIDHIYNYSGKIEIHSRKVYSKAGPIGLCTSLEVMRHIPLPPRKMDSRVSFFTIDSFVKGNPINSTPGNPVVKWSMKPAQKERAPYLLFNLVEPEQPIVFYIDPVTNPAKWVPYLIKGVNDWQQAFEEAGFKNAIMGKVGTTKNGICFTLPYKHSGAIIFQKDFYKEDAFYSTITDPRSGEILQSYILWNPGIIQWLQRSYFIQAATDERITRLPLPDSITGELIRMVISHEVGHALGFPHNYFASNAVSVERLRDKKWVEKNGITASIMDYARCNYVAQPGDNITATKGVLNGIGVYDKWAVKWGYSFFENLTQEIDSLNKWWSSIYEKNGFMSNLSNGDDPRIQIEDLGDDPFKASTYGIDNLKVVLEKLRKWASQTPGDSVLIGTIYNDLIAQYNLYIGHVATFIGGIYKNENNYDEKINERNIIEKGNQEKALQFLNTELFTIPTWIIDDTLLYYGHSNTSELFNYIGRNIFGKLLSSKVVSRMFAAEKILGSKTYCFSNLLHDFKNSLFKVHKMVSERSDALKALQLQYIAQLDNLVSSSDPQTTGYIHATLGHIKKDIKLSIRKFKNRNLIHLKQVIDTIDKIVFLPAN